MDFLNLIFLANFVCYWIVISTNSTNETEHNDWINLCDTRTSYIYIKISSEENKRGWSMISNNDKMKINGVLIRVSMCKSTVRAKALGL